MRAEFSRRIKSSQKRNSSIGKLIWFKRKFSSPKSGLKSSPLLLVSHNLQLERKIFRPAQFRKFALSAVLASIVFTSLLFAVSQSLHEKLHQDASKPSHQCAITLFAQQQILTSEPNIFLVELNVGLVLSIIDADSVIFPQADYRFSVSRAPPVSSFLSFAA